MRLLSIVFLFLLFNNAIAGPIIGGGGGGLVSRRVDSFSISEAFNGLNEENISSPVNFSELFLKNNEFRFRERSENLNILRTFENIDNSERIHLSNYSEYLSNFSE